MITLFRDEMAANRLKTQTQIEFIQQQLSTFQNLIPALMPHLATLIVTTPTPTTDNPKLPQNSEFSDSESSKESPDTQEAPKSPPPIKNVHITD